MYLKSCKVLQDTIPNKQMYPFNIPSLQDLYELEFPTNVTFFVGENGSGNQHYLKQLQIAAILIQRVVVARIYMTYIRQSLHWVNISACRGCRKSRMAFSTIRNILSICQSY